MTDIVTLPIGVPPAPAPVQALGEDTLGLLLGALASRPGPVPKYRYPSAGTLYPVRTYLVLRSPLGTLPSGTFCFDPDAHALVPLSDETPPAPDGSHPAALLLLVAQHAAITPIYRDEAAAFCLLEAGYMEAALRAAAPGLRLREAGDASAAPALEAACRLERDHVPLVCWAVGEEG